MRPRLHEAEGIPADNPLLSLNGISWAPNVWQSSAISHFHLGARLLDRRAGGLRGRLRVTVPPFDRRKVPVAGDFTSRSSVGIDFVQRG
eukprot:scaffold122013_cov45-Phaeocystis_antarctica.AAC.1